jgi:hypothetical protein
MPPLSTWKSGYGPRREGSAASVAIEALAGHVLCLGWQVAEGGGGMGDAGAGRPRLVRGVTGVALVGEKPLAITLAHECSPMQTTHLWKKPRSATTYCQPRILSVASRPGYFAHLVTPLNPGHVFGMICSSMDRLARLRGSRAAPMGRKLSSVLR